jgi:hypothetical protein
MRTMLHLAVSLQVCIPDKLTVTLVQVYIYGKHESKWAVPNKAEVPNLWYAANRLGVREHNVGNGGKHTKKKS